jgi:hypothetical protein
MNRTIPRIDFTTLNQEIKSINYNDNPTAPKLTGLLFENNLEKEASRANTNIRVRLRSPILVEAGKPKSMIKKILNIS